MKNYFKINYYKLVRLLMPVMLRMPQLMAFVEVCVSPIDYLYGLFITNRNSNLYYLEVTPQVFSLEKVLNDRFDYSQRRIYIGKGSRNDQSYLYTNDELLDAYIYTDGEGVDLYLFTSSEVGDDVVRFIVNVPAALRFDENEMRAFLEQFTVKSFAINKY
ncbi:MAG: hypothetical protein E6767_20690 [Dysgonomonas sp.]|nr:hypothetical protein [Dysgonomonas sp.]